MTLLSKELQKNEKTKSRKKHTFPNGNYMFKVNNRNTRTRSEIFSKLTIKIPERRLACSSVSIVNFEQVNAGWVDILNTKEFISFLRTNNLKSACLVLNHLVLELVLHEYLTSL